MDQILGKNQAVRALIAKSAEDRFEFRILSLLTIAWAWYSTRPEGTKDIIRGIPVVIFALFMFFMACFL